MKGECDTCRFWQRDVGGLGECRRWPPVIVTGQIGDGIDPDENLCVGVWPDTLERDWCGEWQPTSAQEKGR